MLGFLGWLCNVKMVWCDVRLFVVVVQCGGGVLVVVWRWCVCCGVTWWCICGVVVWLCSVRWCGCGIVWWCGCGGVVVVVVWCGCGMVWLWYGVVVVWCGGVVFLWWRVCGGVV